MGIFNIGKPKDKAQQPFLISERALMKQGYTQEKAKDIIRAAKADNSLGQPLFKVEESKYGWNPIDMLRKGLFKTQSLKEYTKGAFNLGSALVSLWSNAVNDRRGYIMVSAELKKFYLVHRMLKLIVDDVLNEDNSGKIVSFTSHDVNIQNHLNELAENIDFNTILKDITRDFIDFGEYLLRLEVVEGEGVVAVHDDMDQLNSIVFYEAGWPKQFLHYMVNDYKIEGADKIAHFIMGDAKIRVALEDQISSGLSTTQKSQMSPELREQLPDYIRLGEPIFYNIIAKLRELQLLETLIPAAKLNQITQSHIVGVKIPAANSTEQVIDILKQYEQFLNIPVGIDTTREQLSIAEILTASGKIRVLPIFDDGKGTLEPINARESKPVDDILNSIKDIRSVICTSIGIPPSLVFGSVDQEKSQELRLYSGYTRKLAAIQESLARGFKQIIAIHLKNKAETRNLTITYKDFDVKFLQPLTDIAGLEYAQLVDAKQELAGRTLDFIAKMYACPLLSPYINEENLRKWITKSFNNLTDGLALFNKDPDPNKMAMLNGQFGNAQPGVQDDAGETGYNLKIGSPSQRGKDFDDFDSAGPVGDKQDKSFGLDREVR